MHTGYLLRFSGISGDMFLGAMIDLGVDAQALEHELEKLKLDGWHLRVGRGQKMGISGVKFDVHLPHEHEHSDAGGATHTLPHTQARGHEHTDVHGPHGGPLVKTSFGKVELSVFETNGPPRFQLYFFDSTGQTPTPIAATSVCVETTRKAMYGQHF